MMNGPNHQVKCSSFASPLWVKTDKVPNAIAINNMNAPRRTEVGWIFAFVIRDPLLVEQQIWFGDSLTIWFWGRGRTVFDKTGNCHYSSANTGYACPFILPSRHNTACRVYELAVIIFH